MKSAFTKPEVVVPNDPEKPWLIYYRFEGKAIRKKYGLNYIKNHKQRLREANLICDSIHRRLINGWNPFTSDTETSKLAEMSILEALDFALEEKKKSLAAKSYLGYKGTIGFCKNAIASLRLNNLSIAETKRIHIKSILEKAKTQRKWSNKAFNKNLGYLQAVLSELIQWDIIDFNPSHNIKKYSVPTVLANEPATPEQHKIIKAALENNHPEFYLYIISIFHTGIRPEELLQIRIENVNLEKQEIRLAPEITKTDMYRIVPINNHLLSHFQKIGIENINKSYYLFGSMRPTGEGNRGKFKDFIPGPTRIKRDTATRRWKKIVKDGLGIDVNMYSNKHAGANAKIMAGIDLDSLRELYGHTSKLMTEKYAKVVKEVYRKQIMEKSPDF